MEGYRVRRGKAERTFADLATLRGAATRGELRLGDEVWSPDGWVRADTHPALRGAFAGADPWSAWSDVDEHDAASVYKQMVESAEPEDLPAEALRAVEEPTEDRVPRLPPVVQAPPVPPPPVPPPKAEVPELPRPVAPLPRAEAPRAEGLPAGEVIDFPARPPRPRPAAPPPAQPLVRTSRVVAMVVAGALVLLIGRAWLRVGAFSEAGISEPDPPKTAVPVEVSPLIKLDAEIRQYLSPTPRAVEKAGDLSDALLVELVGARLEVVEAEGLVTKWIGRHGDEPKSAEVRVKYRSNGDMSRELGTIALVVGRYKRLYRLEMPVFEVTDVGTNRMTRIDPDKAEAYYQARITLEELLQAIAGGQAP